MTLKRLWYNILMRFNKNGSPDKRYKKEELSGIVGIETQVNDTWESTRNTNPQEILEQFLLEHNLELNFDVIEGTVSTKYGMITLEKPTLIVKAEYKKG